MKKRLFNGSGYSKISQKLFWDIYESFPENNVHFEELNSEIIRYDKHNKRHYRYDYFDFTTKKVIEFNGDYWHCNPDKYDENYIHTVIKMDAKTIWDRELQKIEWIKNRNYNVLVVWESEYRKNPKQILQKCIDFLNN
jgi:very-short-patch-repair endonuclease